jgi:Family of unknown function (DUF5683)
VRNVFVYLLFSLPLLCRGQWSSQINLDENAKDSLSSWQSKWNQPHSALKATVLALTLPGAGQAYNHKYWKMPIVYAGMGTCVYFIARNTKYYRHYKAEYIKAADNDPNTITEYSAAQIQPVMETYHRWMDISYFSLIGVYALQALDANVDAHLFKFDISKDLSFYWTPLTPFAQGTKGITFGIQF